MQIFDFNIDSIARGAGMDPRALNQMLQSYPELGYAVEGESNFNSLHQVVNGSSIPTKSDYDKARVIGIAYIFNCLSQYFASMSVKTKALSEKLLSKVTGGFGDMKAVLESWINDKKSNVVPRRVQGSFSAALHFLGLKVNLVKSFMADKKALLGLN